MNQRESVVHRLCFTLGEAEHSKGDKQESELHGTTTSSSVSSNSPSASRLTRLGTPAAAAAKHRTVAMMRRRWIMRVLPVVEKEEASQPLWSWSSRQAYRPC